MPSLILNQEWLANLFLVWVRVSTLFLVAPFFSHTRIPVPMRLLLSLGLSYALADLVAQPGAAAMLDSPAALVTGIAAQIGIGIVLGFVAQLVFAGIQVAGHVVGTQVGFSLINIIDPQTSVENSLLTVFLNSLALTLFLTFDGHHMLLQGLARSFELTPARLGQGLPNLWLLLVEHAGGLFAIGLQLVAPAFALMILIDMLLALAGKMAPQVPVLIIGFPVKILMGLLGMGLVLYLFPQAMERHFVAQMRWLERLVQ